MRRWISCGRSFSGISIEIASSQAAFIRDAISNVVSALLLGGALAFLVLFLFLRDPRYPLAIGLAIPISVMAAFALCYAFDVSLNIMSLGGLALGVGLLVDNSIVVLENIFRHREESGGSARESAGRGAREVAAAITASTLTTIAVFGPVLYVEGVAGALFGDLSLAVTFSLLASLLVALTLLPVLAAQVARGRRGAEAAGFDGAMSPSEQPEAAEAKRPGRVRRVGRAVRAGAVAGVRGVGGGVAYVGRSVKLTGVDVATGGGRVLGLLFGPFLRAFERAFLRFAGRYERTLEWALAHRLEVLSIAIVALAGAIMLAGSLPRGLMPRVDEQQFWVELNLPQGTPIRTTDETAGEVERLLLDMADVSGIFTRVGRSRGSELAARDLTGLNNAALDVQLAGSSRPTSEAIAELRARLPGERRGSGLRDDRNRTGHLARQGARDRRGRPRGEGAERGTGGTRAGRRGDRDPARGRPGAGRRAAGLPAHATGTRHRGQPGGGGPPPDHRDVGRDGDRGLPAGVGDPNNAYSVFADKVDIRVTIPETARRELDRVLGLRLQGVPIGELVTVRQGFGPVEIRREDQNRTIQVLADVAEGGLRTAVREVEAAIADIPRPALTTVRVGGENEEMQDSFRSLTFAFGLALALVFLIMAAQFESLVQPLVVLTAVPLAAIGAVTALWIAGGGLNAMSGIGFVILIGIVVNDAIVKVDFINQRRRAGLAKRAAILEAGRLRLRPIVMTTITTVVGLLPLAAGLGAGADLRAPLAVVVIGGLISATFLTLIVVPVVYSVLVEPSVSVGPDPGPRPERRDPSAVRPTPGYGLGDRSGPAAPGMARGSVEP